MKEIKYGDEEKTAFTQKYGKGTLKTKQTFICLFICSLLLLLCHHQHPTTKTNKEQRKKTGIQIKLVDVYACIGNELNSKLFNFLMWWNLSVYVFVINPSPYLLDVSPVFLTIPGKHRNPTVMTQRWMASPWNMWEC